MRQVQGLHVAQDDQRLFPDQAGELAGVDVSLQDLAVHQRPDHASLDVRLGALDLAQGLLELRLGDGDVLGPGRLDAGEVGLGPGQGGLGRLEGVAIAVVVARRRHALSEEVGGPLVDDLGIVELGPRLVHGGRGGGDVLGLRGRLEAIELGASEQQVGLAPVQLGDEIPVVGAEQGLPRLDVSPDRHENFHGHAGDVRADRNVLLAGLHEPGRRDPSAGRIDARRRRDEDLGRRRDLAEFHDRVDPEPQPRDGQQREDEFREHDLPRKKGGADGLRRRCGRSRRKGSR